MNISQAKAVAGISKKRSVFGRKNLLAAIEQCKRGIIAAHPDRTGGNTSRAAELSEAQQVFKERLRGNRCQVSGCGQPISASATHCRMHSRAKASPLPKDFKPAPSTKPGPRANSNARVSGITFDSALAHCGFYTAPVQKVVRKWSRSLPAHALESYFRSLAMAHDSFQLNLEGTMLPTFLPAIFEMGTALCKVQNDKRKPVAWLLRLPLAVSTNHECDSWGELAKRIVKAGGPLFTPTALTEAAHRMKLTIAPDPAAQWKSIAAAQKRIRPL